MKNKINNKRGYCQSRRREGREKASCSKLLRSANSEHFLWSLHYTSKGKGNAKAKKEAENAKNTLI